jgi:hypothetical protein
MVSMVREYRQRHFSARISARIWDLWYVIPVAGRISWCSDEI